MHWRGYPAKCVALEDTAPSRMPLEDEINARLRRLSEEIRNFRKDIDEFRRRERYSPRPAEPSPVAKANDDGSPPKSSDK